jgi:hypothetical protein
VGSRKKIVEAPDLATVKDLFRFCAATGKSMGRMTSPIMISFYSPKISSVICCNVLRRIYHR